MSQTTTVLVTNALAGALDRIIAVHDGLVEQLGARIRGWDDPKIDPKDIESDTLADVLTDLRTAAVAKSVYGKLARSRPEVLPPGNLLYPELFIDTAIRVGDAETLEELACGAAELRRMIEGSAWDITAEAPVPEPAATPNPVDDAIQGTDALGEEGVEDDEVGEVIDDDLGEVVPAPSNLSGEPA